MFGEQSVVKCPVPGKLSKGRTFSSLSGEVSREESTPCWGAARVGRGFGGASDGGAGVCLAEWMPGNRGKVRGGRRKPKELVTNFPSAFAHLSLIHLTDSY